MRTVMTPLLALLLSSFALAGCAPLAAGVAGGIAGSEIEEEDDQFDPLENTEAGEEIYE